jgi:aspartyl/asparaginyl-tRNA synthetase
MNELNKQDSNVIIKNKKPKKQKRIIRRTFKVGKSKHVPKVSVLISNKTLRNKANLQKQALRETSIKDVRRYLLKSGFIKVGTTTPNDVLREMYENAKLVCGDVKNHNPDNLLYNYFNDDEI